MIKKLKYLLNSLATIKNEPKYVADALITHKVDLPNNYWRFTLLRPFINVDAGNSPLLRNFCPLFWVTNLLAVAYVLVAPLIVFCYPFVKLGRALNTWLQNYSDNKQHNLTTEEKAAKKYDLGYVFTVPRFKKIFRGSSHAAFGSTFKLYKQHIANSKEDFDFGEITLEQLLELDDEFGYIMSDKERYLLIFMYRYKTAWEQEFDRLHAAVKDAEADKKVKVDSRKTVIEKRFNKIVPSLVKTCKNVGIFLAGIVVLALVVGTCWGLYTWTIPAIQFVLAELNLLISFLTSFQFLKLLGGIIGVSALIIISYLLLEIPMRMFEDTIVNKCEDYYEEQNQKDAGFYAARKSAEHALKKNKYKAAFFTMLALMFFGFITNIVAWMYAILSWPFIFVKMFYAKNCPAINVVNPDDTNTQTEPADTKS